MLSSCYLCGDLTIPRAMITALIITYNEERNIARCLQSLLAVSDEILVIDSFSTDKTKEICSAFPCRFVEMEWLGYSATKNEGQKLATYPYILSLDADEALSEALQREILEAKPRLRGAYAMPRKNFFAGQWIRGCGWYPDRKIRLFPKAESHWSGDFVHESLSTVSEVHRFKSDILHFSYETEAEFDQKTEKYACLAAQELVHKGKKANFVKLYLSPVVKFLQVYVWKYGFVDGYRGWYIASRSAYGAYLKYHKISSFRK